MKTLLLLTTAISVLISCQTPEDKPVTTKVETTSSAKDGILIHITGGYEDPHRVLMPLKMANMMSADKDVILYLDIDAVNLVLNESEDLEYEGFDPLKMQLQSLIAKNIAIYACPTCLNVAGYSPEDLVEGVQIADKEKFFNFTEGHIVSLSY